MEITDWIVGDKVRLKPGSSNFDLFGPEEARVSRTDKGINAVLIVFINKTLDYPSWWVSPDEIVHSVMEIVPPPVDEDCFY